TKNIFKTDSDWKLVKSIKNVSSEILERCVFKHKTKNVYLVADAWDGATIKKKKTRTWGRMRRGETKP
ncbi:MAG: hypothetical protein ACO1OT_14045, partial [Heyndrickxia sp.]